MRKMDENRVPVVINELVISRTSFLKKKKKAEKHVFYEDQYHSLSDVTAKVNGGRYNKV